MRLAAMITAALALAGCATMDEADLVPWLEAQGYSDVRKVGARNYFNGCTHFVQTATEFTAIGPNGARVNGAVCRGTGFSARYAVVYGVR